MKLSRVSCVACVALWAVACQTKKAPTPKTPAKPAATTANAAAKPNAAKSPVSDACVGPIGPGAKKTVTIAGTTWERNGSTLTEKGAAKGPLVIGAITDIKEDSPANKANLKAFLAWFKKNHVQLILVAGDTGYTQAQLEDSLDILSTSGVPVFNIIGNREGNKVYRAALADVTSQHNNVFDLDVIRRIDTPQLDVISMPGYFDRTYLHSTDGCQYTSADVAKLAELVKASNSPVMLISHGGPKQLGPNAIDRTSQGANVGDPALAKAIADNKIPFGLFGNIHEAGGHATDATGKEVLKPNTMYASFYLNPGPADGVRWEMNDKTISNGMAGIVTVANGKARYQIFRRPDPDAAVEKEVAEAKAAKAHGRHHAHEAHHAGKKAKH